MMITKLGSVCDAKNDSFSDFCEYLHYSPNLGDISTLFETVKLQECNSIVYGLLKSLLSAELTILQPEAVQRIAS